MTAPRPQSLPLSISPPDISTVMTREGWEFVLTEKEVANLRKPITTSSGGWQSAMREAATCIHEGRVWKPSYQLVAKLWKMLTKIGPHGGYQGRIPMRVLSPVFIDRGDELLKATWFYGKREKGDTALVKFGKTDNNPRRHRAGWSTDNPRALEILFVLWDPTGEFEKRVHNRFRTNRVNHKGAVEWFKVTPLVATFINECQQVRTTADIDMGWL